ncbi:SDR family NAD(P)-dependent oxidoreductase [Veronia pacifica]|uniref:Short-chain dehydrogenase n=1 Tax=Veronia pacifica TaxID=1080227 RepID=A0A1C3EMX0_9GAMM|nr:SDR family NAD(P)-dependent oxidoreductase [Veronia pacifica]ODA34572.1 short-chain dehydrogenase [Veronia pacifica]
MKTVLITGATSGIGMKLAEDYAIDGWRVTGCGRSTSALEALSERYQNFDVLRFDTSDQEECEQALGNLVHNPDLIILNAGTCEYIDNGQVDAALFKRVFTTNVFGVVNCLEVLQRSYKEGTHVALMGSTASYLGLPRAEAYGASKAAINYLARTLSVDLEHLGVTVSLISPGFVKTPLTDKNDFPMPMMVTTEEASSTIRAGLEKKKNEIHFPRRFSLILKFIATLPVFLQLMLVRRLVRKTS